MHGLFPKRVLDTVLDAMTDCEKLSLEVLDNETKSRAFALVILKMRSNRHCYLTFLRAGITCLGWISDGCGRRLEGSQASSPAVR